MTRVVSLDEIRPLVNLGEAITAVRHALIDHAHGRATSPFPWHIELPEVDGEIHVKGAHLHGAPYVAIKISGGSYRNAARALPTSGGMVAVLDANTALLEFLLLDNGYLTDLRTAAAGAAAADALARTDIGTVTVVGTGGQARYQLAALLHVRQPRRLLICGRSSAHAEALAGWARTQHTWQVTVTTDVRAGLSATDVVITVTPATAPVIRAEWLPDGVHITAVGADAPHKRELDPKVIARADRIAVDNLTQARRLGELKHLHDDALAALPITALGAVLAGTSTGRVNDTDITVADLTGLGVQDTAVANLVARRLAEQ